ncbi:Pyridoxine 5'-phosphate oxidase family protein containing flavin binding domain [Methanonatronarchaeum thermophilum]|uniref:Pyridoxine 5'-phosphate oxidase family protein containing flavin binding domain n=1 Tax=Methanonatronarchaeum thermophilum TaxID=1927129 RepID=A0A1Y3GGN3_9EURY|nr:pyridoxamine 5'-phosphate oxidase family protein [Methanonatronarchaeum thermophilum]OUJ18595.1 Pyridoxine 5'-phosphate oxidase family protein containing flavin binding domain [Methanonatronarchaeum thermophilum]
MVKIPDEVLDLLGDPDTQIVLATADDSSMPNAVPMRNVWIVDDDKMALGDVFFDKTRSNIEANGLVSLSLWKGTEGYQLKGTCSEIKSSGALFEEKKEMLAEKMDLDLQALCMIDVEEVFSTAPGPDAGSKIS